MSKTTDIHEWSESDNLLALYYYKYKTELLGIDETQIATMIGTTLTTFKKQSSNFRRYQKFTDRLSEKAKSQALLYEKYGELSRYDLFKLLKENTKLDETINNRLLEINYPHRNLRKL